MTNHPANERVLGVRGRKLHFREQRIPNDEPADVTNTQKKILTKIWNYLMNCVGCDLLISCRGSPSSLPRNRSYSPRVYAKKNSPLFEACKQYSQKRLCRRGTPKKKITVIRMLIQTYVHISVENRLIKTLLIDTRIEIQKPSIKYIRICMYRSLTDYSTSRIFSTETLCQNLLNLIIALNPKMRLKYVSRVIFSEFNFCAHQNEYLVILTLLKIFFLWCAK